jgi:predicted RNase H-like HicB family nuclease
MRVANGRKSHHAARACKVCELSVVIGRFAQNYRRQEINFMKIQASFVQDGKRWVAWTDDIPCALTQGATLEEARENLREKSQGVWVETLQRLVP